MGAEAIGEAGDFLKFPFHLQGNFFACWFSHTNHTMSLLSAIAA
ncbi:MAG: hypothetical protein V7K92_27320 [Nostoc sp.]